MLIQLPARLRKMNKRRRKIALRKMVRTDLMKFWGKPITQDTGMQIATLLVDKYGAHLPQADYQPITMEVLGITHTEPDKLLIDIQVQGGSMQG